MNVLPASLAIIAAATALSGWSARRWGAEQDCADLRTAVGMLVLTAAMMVLRAPLLPAVGLVVLGTMIAVEVNAGLSACRAPGGWRTAGHRMHGVLCVLAMAVMLVPMPGHGGSGTGHSARGMSGTGGGGEMTMAMPSAGAAGSSAALLCLGLVYLSVCATLFVHARCRDGLRVTAPRTASRLLVSLGMVIPALSLL